MSSTGPETRLVGRIRKAIKEQWPDAWVFKVAGSPFQEAGIPDLLVCVDGLLAGIEVKAPKPGESRAALAHRVTPAQRVQLARLRSAGAVDAVVTTVDEALAAVRRLIYS